MQTPFGPVHCALLVHCTHRFAPVSQTGVEPVHADWFAAEHSAQLPDFTPAPPRHAGAVAVVHAAD